MWHGYFVVERQNLGDGNWIDLLLTFKEMGTTGSRFPMYNNHHRVRLDGNAIIYESNFNPGEVTVAGFKQLLADEFGVAIEDIDDDRSQESYAGYTTPVWEFLYGALSRFTVRRFGGGDDWDTSNLECLGYLSQNLNEWESAP